MTALHKRSLRTLIIVGIVATVALTSLSVVAVGAFAGSAIPEGFGGRPNSGCTSPHLTGSVVNVTETNMGGPMMGQGGGMMFGGAMALTADRSTVSHGTVSFLVANEGSITHEMVVLPLVAGQPVGERTTGGDGKVDEKGSLGEASKSCGAGAGGGLLPGTAGWVSMTLKPGKYELICNLAGHYTAGMYTQLTVT